MEDKEYTVDNIFKLRKALEIGENSCMITNFDPKKHLQELHNKYLNKAGL